MEYSAVPYDALNETLLTVGEARQRMATTEPLDCVTFWTGSLDNRIGYGKDWFESEPTEASTAWLAVPGRGMFQLTFQAAQQLGSTCRINQKYQIAVPPELLASHVNWWLQEGLEERELKLLIAGTGEFEGRPVPLAVAQCRATIVPFSNLQLLDVILATIRARLGDAAADSVLIDYKLFHDLEHTSFRVIIPAVQQVVTGTDIEDDAWCYGIEVRNSIIGTKQTQVNGYLFRFATTAGVTDVEHGSGGFNRRGSAPDDVYVWAAESARDILRNLESAFEGLKVIAGRVVDGDYATVLGQLFREHPVAKELKLRIISELETVPSELTMYDLAHAASNAANLDDTGWRAVLSLHELAGYIVHQGGGMCDGSLPEGCRRLLDRDWVSPDGMPEDDMADESAS
jgi:hypothetical protein